MSDFDLILENGIKFGRGGDRPKQDDKIKTKAKKKKYITGAHGSGSAMQKAKYRKQRANRNHKLPPAGGYWGFPHPVIYVSIMRTLAAMDYMSHCCQRLPFV